MVAALFNPKTPTQNVYIHVIRTQHTHTIACGKLQMIHSIALAWCSVSSTTRSLAHAHTYVSMQLSFAKWFMAIHRRRLQAIEQTSRTSEQVGQSLWKKSYAHIHIHIYTESMPNNMWNNIVDLNSRCIHVPCDFAFCQRFWLVFCLYATVVCSRVRHFTMEIPHNMERKFLFCFVLRIFSKNWRVQFGMILPLRHSRSIVIPVNTEMRAE